MIGHSLRFAELQTQTHLIVVGVEVAPGGETRVIATLTSATNSARQRSEDRRAAAAWILERFNAHVLVAKSSGWVTLPEDAGYRAAVMAWAEKAPDNSGTIAEGLVTNDSVAGLADQACALLRDAARGMRIDDFKKFWWSPNDLIELPSGRAFTPPQAANSAPLHVEAPVQSTAPSARILEARRAFDKKRFPWLSEET